MNTHVLEADSIIATVGGRKILSDVYLRCQSGEVVGVLGRNGTGKSTLLKLIFGTLPTEDRNIRIDGEVIHPPHLQGKWIAYLPQQGFLPKNIPIRKIVDLYVDVENRKKILADERIKPHLKKRTRELSGGELRYLEILLLVNLKVKFILLDEPFSGIEPLYQDKVVDLINEYRPEKGFIVTDHVYKQIISISDKLLLIDQGKTIPITKPEELEQFSYVPRGTFSNSVLPKLASGSLPGFLNSGETGSPDQPRVAFEIDKQTWKDLDLFDQGRKGLVYALFNNVKTVGGGDRLEQMFKYPSNDVELLEARRDAIRFFCDNGIDLNIGRQQMDTIEHYLSASIPLYPDYWLDALLYNLRNKFKQTNNHYLVTIGIRTTVSTLRHFFRLADQLRAKGCPYHLAAMSLNINELIADEKVREIVSSVNTDLSVMDMAKCDHYFRRRGREQVRRILDTIYEFDVYQSVAAAAQKYSLSFPEYSNQPGSSIQVRGLFHPLLASPVSNDYRIDNETNLCFISGANMSGKSTFLKAFGLSVYLSHIGFPVPAAFMETTLFNGLITTINLSDNISQGYSHFYNEVRRVKDVALKIKEKKKIVVLFDELFRGTNVKDASDASLQVIGSLSKVRNSLFLISTHIVEIAGDLRHNKNIFFNCFESTMEAGVPWYNYKIREGISNERVGMLIIKNERIIEILEEVGATKSLWSE